MPNKFKAILIDNQNNQFTREVKEVTEDILKDGNVLVKVDYSSLNFKDALILKNGARLVKEFPHIPGIDFCGIVEESKHKDFKVGDEIILISPILVFQLSWYFLGKKDGLLFAFCYGILATSYACYKFYLDDWRDED